MLHGALKWLIFCHVGAKEKAKQITRAEKELMQAKKDMLPLLVLIPVLDFLPGLLPSNVETLD